MTDTRDRARTLLADAVSTAVPGVDMASLGEDDDVRLELDLDSMDMLAVLSRIEESAGLAIADADAASLQTLGEWIDHLAPRLADM